MGFLSGILLKKNVATLRRTSPATAERIRNILGIRELEMMPAQAARAFQLASDPRAKSDDFVRVIESDEVLSARVVRVANSVYFFRGTPANDIEKAVANIGLNELRCLLSAAMLKNLLQIRHPSREQIWANSVATAICCRNLSGNLKEVSSGEAFLCGLLHDVGKLVMIRRSAELYDKVILLAGAGELDFIEAEEKILELNHVEVGKWVGEVWNFPDSVVSAISLHHEPWPLKHRGPLTLPLVVAIGDVIAHARSIGHPASMRKFAKRSQEQLPRAFELAGIQDPESFIKQFEENFEREISLYQSEIK